MEIAVVFESMFGATHDVADAIAAGVAEAQRDATVTVLRVGDADPGRVAAADLLIVGGPTHMRGMTSGMSRKLAAQMEEKSDHDKGTPVGHGLEPDVGGPGLRDWFHQLPKTTQGRRAAAFDTRGEGAMMGGAAKGIGHRLESHGYTMVAEPEGFIIEGDAQLLRAGEQDRARAWAAGLVRAAATSGEGAVTPIAPPGRRSEIVRPAGASSGQVREDLLSDIHLSGWDAVLLSGPTEPSLGTNVLETTRGLQVFHGAATRCAGTEVPSRCVRRPWGVAFAAPSVGLPPTRGAAVQVRDVMTREVFTVGPDTSAKYAAEVMADRGYAALPVVDDDYQLVGIVAEADVLQDRLPRDPRLHLRRDEEGSEPPPPLLVRGVMTVGVRTADAGADIADVARLFVDGGLRSVPVLEHDRLAGIVSRRDLLAALVRPDTEIRQDLVRLVEGYTGDPACWDVTVVEGVATIGRTRGTPEVPAQVEERALRSLAHTVAGVVRVRILPASEEAAGRQNESAPAMGKDTSA